MRIIIASVLLSVVMAAMAYCSNTTYQYQKAAIASSSGIVFFWFFYKFKK